MMRRVLPLLGLLVCAGLAPPAEAQDRATRLANAVAAYDNFETDRALRLFKDALNPALGPADSLWFRGAQFLVQILFEESRAQEAQVWTRWAARLAPDEQLDTLVFVSDVVDAFQNARASIQSEPVAGDVARMSWAWPTQAPSGDAPGQLRVLAGQGVSGLSVLLVGRGVLQPGQSQSLAPGSYTLEASASGFRTARVTREVLPGVTTVIAFNLEPATVANATELAPAARTDALGRLVRISADRFGMAPECGLGMVVGGSGMVLTSYEAIRGARAVRARIGQGQEMGDQIVVLAYDADANLAALGVPVVRQDSAPVAAGVEGNQFLWTLSAPTCDAAQVARAQVGTASPTDVTFGDSLPAAGTTVLIDAGGSVAGVVTGSNTAVPPARVARLLTEARRNATGRATQTVAEVARAEQHAFGAVDLSANVAGAVATITPLEDHHWPGLVRTGPLPFRFVGPEGRYQLEVHVGGVRRDQREFTVRAAQADRVSLQLGQPGEPAQLTEAGGGGGFPWIIAVLGAAGAGAAAFLLGGGGTDTTTTPGGNTGTITISIPNR